MGGGSDVIRVRGRKSFFSSLSCISKSSVAMYPENGDQESEREEVKVEVVVEEKEEVKVDFIVRSCMRKKANKNQDQDQEQDQDQDQEDLVKGRVKWMDTLGKDLVEIKEYEAR